MIGRTLDHYHIEEKLGEGGMGVVYRARDTHLDRDVAIKVLRADATADPVRKRRFVQEAKAASALNHPNIITIYDIDQADGVDFIAMEFVPGKTLEHLIGRKGLVLHETLKYSVQIADALARAHGAGIIHRDLKPANIMVNEHGQVKVLDFGLAKLTEREPEDEGGATVSLARGTEEGMILGTIAYMSPEQAEGKKLDARSDIFSFGSVLYEMTTGGQAFRGESRMSTVMAVLREEPQAAGELVEGLPRDLEKIIARCLRKDLERRFQNASDLKVALLELKEESESGRLSAVPAAPPPRATGRRGLAIGLAAGALLAVAAASLTWWLTRPKAPPGAAVLTRLTSDTGLTTDPDISPNGSLLAYASDRSGEGNLDIWVQQIPGGEPVRVTRHESDDRQPAFSPDGARIAFRSERDGGGVYVMPALGGAERLLAPQGRNPRFSPDGKWIAYAVGGRGVRPRIFIIPATGGSPRSLRPEGEVAGRPVWSPDSKAVLFGRGEGGGGDWWVSPLEGGSAVSTGAVEILGRHRLFAGPAQVWTPKGDQIIFSARLGDSTGLWKITISPKTWKVTGDPERLTAGTGNERQVALGGARLVFSSYSENIDIWSAPMDTNKGQARGPIVPLTRDAARDEWPSLSADGRKMTFESSRSGNSDIWVKDLTSGRETPLTSSPLDEGHPSFSPDGSRVAYNAQEGGKPAIYIVAAAGGAPEKVCEDCGRLWTWSADGKSMLFARLRPARQILLEVGSGRQVELLKFVKGQLDNVHFSPDGRWVSFLTWPSADRTREWIAPFGAEIPESSWIPITDGEAADIENCWSPDGNRLYFTSERDGFLCLWTQRLDPASKRPVGAAEAVLHFHLPSRRMDNVLSPLGLAAARDRLVFELHEFSGNIWMTSISQ